MPEDKKQICSIRIMFPVESDEHAIEYKKKIGGVIADIPEATIQFSLTDMARGMPSLPR